MSEKSRSGAGETIRLGQKTAELALAGVFTALVCVFTMYVQVQIFPAKGGLVHLGNVPLFFAAAFFGRRVGALCGGLGMALSDVLTPWAVYAPVSLVVVGLMGFVFGWIVGEKPVLSRLLPAVAAVLAIKLAGYYVGEALIFHSFLVPVYSITGNAIQIVTGAVIAIPLILTVRPVMLRLTGSGRGNK